jgi:CubicO group peptidase (beta-lactamase class C family)
MSQSEIGGALDSVAASVWEGRFSGSILVARGDEILLCKGYGMAHVETSRPNTPLTVFDAGSLAKAFTAVATLQLVEAGKLRLDQTMETLFSAVPPDKSRITVHQLLTHTAGLQPYHDDGDDFQLLDRSDALKRILAAPLRFEPGSQYRYSNSGHTLLAAIIENVSGLSWTDYLPRHLFLPAGMEHTGFYGDQRWRTSGAAHAYDNNGRDRGSPLSWKGPSWVLIGNGGIVTNVVDLFRWHRALQGGALLGSRWVAELMAPKQSSKPYLPNRYEGIRDVADSVMVSYFGWRWRGPDRVDVLEKGGAMDYGHTSLFRYEPERDVVIVVLSNKWVQDPQGLLLRVPLMDALHAAVVRLIVPMKDAA